MKTISGIGIGKRYEVKGKALQKLRKALYRMGYLGHSEKGKRTHQVLRELPARGKLWPEYRKKFYTRDLGTVVEDALSEIEELAQEMGEWSSNLEDGGLGHTQVAEQAYECSDVLEDQAATLDNLTTPGAWGAVRLVVAIPYDVFLLSGRSRNIGRWKRLANALSGLEAIVSMAGDEMSQEEDEWMGALQEIIDELNCVEFPGAYG